jgi:hypothetical protein
MQKQFKKRFPYRVVLPIAPTIYTARSIYSTDKWHFGLQNQKMLHKIANICKKSKMTSKKV